MMMSKQCIKDFFKINFENNQILDKFGKCLFKSKVFSNDFFNLSFKNFIFLGSL